MKIIIVRSRGQERTRRGNKQMLIQNRNNIIKKITLVYYNKIYLTIYKRTENIESNALAAQD